MSRIIQFVGKMFNKLLILAGLCLSLVTMVGCSQQDRYMETHNILHLNVVFLDDKSIQDMWKSKTGQPGIQFQPWLRGDLAAVKTVRGFYDFSTETLYCPKWNFEVCGHELHHAALGYFHPKH